MPAKPSRAALVVGTFTPRVVGLLVAYVLFGIVFALAYGFTLTSRTPSVALGWFAPTKGYKWHGNERLWFLVSGTVVFFFSIGLRDVFATQLGPRWPKTRVSEIPVARADPSSASPRLFAARSSPASLASDPTLPLSTTSASRPS